jgi:uncharacterized cupin superfamily protein
MSCIGHWDDERHGPRIHQVVAPGAALEPFTAARAAAEQWVCVVGGTGTAPDGSPVRQGHVWLHRPFDEVPAFTAGDDGLELVVLGPRRPPRAFAEPHPGPRLCHADDCELYHDSHGGVDLSEHLIADALGSEHSGVGLVRLAPRKRGYPQHTHTAEDEIYVVLDGSGTALLDDERHPIGPGSVVDTPTSLRPHVARAFEAGDDGLLYLCWGEREPGDIAVQRESGKVLIRGNRTIFRPERLDYWDGEPSA